MKLNKIWLRNQVLVILTYTSIWHRRDMNVLLQSQWWQWSTIQQRLHRLRRNTCQDSYKRNAVQKHGHNIGYLEKRRASFHPSMESDIPLESTPTVTFPWAWAHDEKRCWNARKMGSHQWSEDKTMETATVYHLLAWSSSLRWKR